MSNKKLGGWWGHVRDGFNSCDWAFCTSQEEGTTMNFKVLAEGPDQFFWAPRVKHGAAKGKWHYPGAQCSMTTDAQIRADDEKDAKPEKVAVHSGGH